MYTSTQVKTKSFKITSTVFWNIYEQFVPKTPVPDNKIQEVAAQIAERIIEELYDIEQGSSEENYVSSAVCLAVLIMSAEKQNSKPNEFGIRFSNDKEITIKLNSESKALFREILRQAVNSVWQKHIKDWSFNYAISDMVLDESLAAQEDIITVTYIGF